MRVAWVEARASGAANEKWIDEKTGHRRVRVRAVRLDRISFVQMRASE
jgi:hypothetical protein